MSTIAYSDNKIVASFVPPVRAIEYVKADAIKGTDLSEEIIAKILERFSKAPIVQHKCHNCGATVEMDADKHIFICRYCGSAYAIGTAHVNDFI